MRLSGKGTVQNHFVTMVRCPGWCFFVTAVGQGLAPTAKTLRQLAYLDRQKTAGLYKKYIKAIRSPLTPLETPCNLFDVPIK